MTTPMTASNSSHDHSCPVSKSPVTAELPGAPSTDAYLPLIRHRPTLPVFDLGAHRRRPIRDLKDTALRRATSPLLPSCRPRFHPVIHNAPDSNQQGVLAGHVRCRETTYETLSSISRHTAVRSAVRRAARTGETHGEEYSGTLRRMSAPPRSHPSYTDLRVDHCMITGAMGREGRRRQEGTTQWTAATPVECADGDAECSGQMVATAGHLGAGRTLPTAGGEGVPLDRPAARR